MGAARQTLQLDPHRAGTIRRVVRRGALYLCGLCRSHYDGERDAQACVRHCWRELLSLAPVLPRRRLFHVVFRCRFCARDHAEHDLAAQCAADCRQRLQQRFDAEVAASGMPDSPSRPRPKALRPAPVLVRVAPPPRPRAGAAAPAAVEAPAASSETAPVRADAQPEPVAQAAAPAAAPAASDAGGGGAKRKVDDAHMFFRDGARYVCNNCKKKHFTRDEVVKCFEGHA